MSQSRTPKGMIKLVRSRIIQRKLRLIGKTMHKDYNNLGKQALIAGEKTCNGEDLLTDCINLCKELDEKCTSKGNHNKTAICKTV